MIIYTSLRRVPDTYSAQFFFFFIFFYFLIFYLFIYLFIYLWLCWVFVSV